MGWPVRLRDNCDGAACTTALCAASAVALCAVVVQAADEVARRGWAGEDIVLREHAGWDRNCNAVTPPALHLDTPPQHGTVCARAADIRIESLSYGTQAHCIGRLVHGCD